MGEHSHDDPGHGHDHSHHDHDHDHAGHDEHAGFATGQEVEGETLEKDHSW